MKQTSDRRAAREREGDEVNLEYLATQLQNHGFHFNLSRTRCPYGHWECRFTPHSMDYEHDYPFGKDDDLDKAIRQAVDSLPKEIREQITVA